MRVSVVIDADGVEVDLTAHEDLPAIRRREIEIYVANCKGLKSSGLGLEIIGNLDPN
ncbi:hypothetical protein [Kiloniella sp.]|uniref:hypothetical protein n=1 Tax=Kiloniella sp. TaxID=1938587 RepID=UPI003B0288DF